MHRRSCDLCRSFRSCRDCAQAAPRHKRARMSSAIAQPARRAVPLRPGRACSRPDLGLLPAARRRHLVVRRSQQIALRAAAGDRRRRPPERQPVDRVRAICPAHAGGGGSGHPLCRRPLRARRCRARVRRHARPPGADRRQCRPQRHLRRRVSIADARRRHRRHLAARAAAADQRRRASGLPRPSRAQRRPAVRQPARAVAAPRPEPDLAEPAAEQSRRLVRRRDRGQHPARASSPPSTATPQVNPGDIMVGDRPRRHHPGAAGRLDRELRRGHARHGGDAPADAESQRHPSRPERASTARSAISAIGGSRDYRLFVTYGVLRSEVLAPSQPSRPHLHRRRRPGQPAVIIAFAALLTLYLSRRERREAEMAPGQRAAAGGAADRPDRRLGLRPAHRRGLSGRRSSARSSSATPDQGSPTFEEFKAYLDEEGRAAIDRAHAEAIRTGESAGGRI